MLRRRHECQRCTHECVRHTATKKKRFQVTQAAIRSPTGMHGQSLAYSVVEADPFAPRNRIWAITDQCARACLRLLPARDLRLETAFCSPAAIVPFRETPAARLTPLTYFFGEIPNCSSSPFGFDLPPSDVFATSPGMFIAQNPLPSCKLRTLKCPPTFAPLWDLHPSGS